ncbi:MAG: hypothetical protein JST73_05900 [Actinobacteria bacterium]|nr:hypothetical protein [Actinomycetota bacterium]
MASQLTVDRHLSYLERVSLMFTLANFSMTDSTARTAAALFDPARMRIADALDAAVGSQ